MTEPTDDQLRAIAAVIETETGVGGDAAIMAASAAFEVVRDQLESARADSVYKAGVKATEGAVSSDDSQRIVTAVELVMSGRYSPHFVVGMVDAIHGDAVKLGQETERKRIAKKLRNADITVTGNHTAATFVENA